MDMVIDMNNNATPSRGKTEAGAVGRKLRSGAGATLIVALLFFLLCAVVGSSVLAAGSATMSRVVNQRKEAQDYYTLTSAAELLRDEIAACPVTIKVTEELADGVRYARSITYDNDGAASSLTLPEAWVSGRDAGSAAARSLSVEAAADDGTKLTAYVYLLPPASGAAVNNGADYVIPDDGAYTMTYIITNNPSFNGTDYASEATVAGSSVKCQYLKLTLISGIRSSNYSSSVTVDSQTITNAEGVEETVDVIYETNTTTVVVAWEASDAKIEQVSGG